jgi:hypothetical protein
MNTLYRYWCNTCKDFTLQRPHHPEEEPHCTCTICNSLNISYKLSDVPEEKIKEQRARYSAMKKNNFIELTNAYLSVASNPFVGLFNEVHDPFPKIIEDDAGQKVIDEKLKKLKDEEWERIKEAKMALRQEYLSYKTLGRNDKCKCGSGNKYKQCCLNKFSTI